MTSLELQLNRLQSAAPTQELAASRDFSSLLFDEKEAANYTREQFYDIGLTGLSHLCKFDAEFDTYESQLFDRSKLDINRGLLQKDENEELDQSLQRIIVRLSPYFHYFACKQVLEWLIHNFKVHTYNAELLAISFMPYHASNSYGRLLRILRFQRPEWNFAQQYAHDAAPIPMGVLMRICHAKNSAGFFFVPSLANFLVDASKIVGEEYVTQRLHTTFTFFASFMVHLFEDPSKVNDQLIARTMPYVGIALKSKVAPFKYAGMMIASRIALSTQLTEEILSSILKLTLLKVKKPYLELALDTVLLICQKQKVTALPRKAIMKMLNNCEEFDFLSVLKKRIQLYDMSTFLCALWSTLFGVLMQESEKEQRKALASIMVEILDLDILGAGNASGFLSALLVALTDVKDTPTQILSKNLRKHVHAIVIRYSVAFDTLRAEWMVRDKEILDLLMSVCQIQAHEVGEIFIKRSRRTRTSSCGSTRRSFTLHDDLALMSEIYEDTDNFITAKEKMRNAQSQVVEQRALFRKPVLKILEIIEEKHDIDAIEWALDALCQPSYLKKQSLDELEQFFLKMVLYISRNPKFIAKVKLKTALAHIKLDLEIIEFLLSDLTMFEPTSKRTKFSVKSTEEQIAALFAGESCIECQRRIVFTLEVFNISSAINFGALATPKMIRKLFELIDREQGKIMSSSTDTSARSSSAYIQQLGLVFATKILEKSKFPSADHFVLDALVKLIRFAHTTTVMRNALRVLELVAPIIPNATVSQFMSLFTFMGDSVIRRDNETTLHIFEETLHTLFGAILKTGTGKSIQRFHSTSVELDFQRKILEIMRIFAKSLMDIPAHRRVRILRAVLSTVPRHNVWIVLAVFFEDHCVRWQKAKSTGQKLNQSLDELLLELVGELPVDDQLEIVHNFSEYLELLGGNTNMGCEKQAIANMHAVVEGNDGELTPTTMVNGDASKTKIAPATTTINSALVIFDRATHSAHTLRHFRFIVFRFINKCIESISALRRQQKENK